jgi:hypothetical protein
MKKCLFKKLTALELNFYCLSAEQITVSLLTKCEAFLVIFFKTLGKLSVYTLFQIVPRAHVVDGRHVYIKSGNIRSAIYNTC